MTSGPARTGSPPRSVETSAHAKVNLALSVAPPVPQGDPHAGMHPICSWMACIDLHDTLRIERLHQGPTRLDLAWDDGRPLAWPAPSDLTTRAHALLESAAACELPVRITLRKSIPDGGGLGGGSSDAASVLLAIDRLFSLGFGPERLRELSAALGSDVAFFLDDEAPARPAIVSGLGDRLERLPRLNAELILICPPFGCATGAVYRAYDASPGPLRERDVRDLTGAALGAPAALFNDLGAPAQSVEPRLAEIRAAVAATGLPVHVSGSGSTLFVVAGPDRLGAVRAAAPSCRVLPARLV